MAKLLWYFSIGKAASSHRSVHLSTEASYLNLFIAYSFQQSDAGKLSAVTLARSFVVLRFHTFSVGQKAIPSFWPDSEGARRIECQPHLINLEFFIALLRRSSMIHDPTYVSSRAGQRAAQPVATLHAAKFIHRGRIQPSGEETLIGFKVVLFTECSASVWPYNTTTETFRLFQSV